MRVTGKIVRLFLQNLINDSSNILMNERNATDTYIVFKPKREA